MGIAGCNWVKVSGGKGKHVSQGRNYYNVYTYTYLDVLCGL